MLWSLLKIAVFIIIAAALAWGASFLLDTPGGVTIAFGGREFAVTPLGFVIWLIVLVIAAVILLNLVGLIVAVIRFIFGDETALSRFFSRGRQQRGVDALSSSMLALASGEPDLALRKAQKAERLLGRREMTALVKAQAAEMAGDRKKALDSYASLLAEDHTRFAGMNGAMRLKLEEGQTDVALALAKKAFALRPDNKPLLGTLFELQSSTGDWAGARETLNALMHARHMPRDVGARRDAILSLADARKAIAEGDLARGHAAAKQANKLAPTLVPAAALASEAYAAEGSKRKATKALTRAWAEDQHPDVAAAFAALEPTETPAARRRRFEALIAAAPASPESRLLAAELAIADEDFPGARKALGDLAESEPTTRSLAVMAAIERGQGAPDAVVRGWLAKAVSAPRGPQWTCAKCHHVHAIWTPVCGECGAFDTLDWRSPAHAEGVEASMLPLIVGAGEPEPEAEPEPRPQAQPAA